MDEEIFPYAFQETPCDRTRESIATIPRDHIGLSAYLERHLGTEKEALDAYQRLVDERPDDIIRYLVRSILKDESRHHDMFAEILNSLESIIRWEDISPRVPPVRVQVDDRDALLTTTDRLLEIEQADAKELHRLRKAWSNAGGEFGLWALLVEGAELDTEKHIRILKYLRHLITEAEPAA